MSCENGPSARVAGETEFTVYLVDDDAGVLGALQRLLHASGYGTRCFASPQAFLADHDPSLPGCAIFDVAMPDHDGLELQESLTRNGAARPVIFLTGRGDIPTSVRAMKAGAVDFLTKPVERDALMNAIGRAQQQDEADRRSREQLRAIADRMDKLTPREREVMTHVIAGRLNKQIAFELGTVEKTIKVHRSRMMHKMGARNVADLVRMDEQTGGLMAS